MYAAHASSSFNPNIVNILLNRFSTYRNLLGDLFSIQSTMSTQDWEEMYDDSIQASRDNTIDQKALKEVHLAVEAILKAGLSEHPKYRLPDGHDTPTYAERLDVPKEFRQTISYLEAVYRRRYPNDPKFQTRDPADLRSEVQDLRDWIAKRYL